MKRNLHKPNKNVTVVIDVSFTEEIEIIKNFLPTQLSADEMKQAITKAIAETGAGSIKDMGQVMGYLKAHYAGQMDFSSASQDVKAA